MDRYRSIVGRRSPRELSELVPAEPSGATTLVQAYGYAGTFRLRELASCFEDAEVRVEKDRLLASYAGGAHALAYDFGSVVFIGVPSATQDQVRQRLAATLTNEPHAPLTEEFLLEIGAAQSVQFDRIVVPVRTLEVEEIIAEVLAQSVAIDYYAKDVAEIENATDRIAGALRSSGRLGSVRSMTRFVGLCIATRNDIISTLALFDKPDATWDNEQLDRLWTGVRRVLEVDDRYRALEAKLALFQDNLVVLVDLARQRNMMALEVTVALLILLEIVVTVWQVMGMHH